MGGLETCIEVPSYKLCVDIGRCPPSAAKLKRVLFTHGHVDHMGGVVHHTAMRDLWGMSPPEYAMPEACAEPFAALLEAWRALDRSPLPCTVRPVQPGDRIELGGHRYAKVFACIHRVPTVGYALVRKHRSLRPELEGLPGPEIARIRERGEPVSVEAEIVEAAICGDTTADVIDREPLVREARVLVLEATFLDERAGPAKARRTGHTHLDDLAARADLLDNRHILLTHASARYGPAQIADLVARRLPPGLRERVTALLPGPPWTRPRRDNA